jgi:hypothetical protein
VVLPPQLEWKGFDDSELHTVSWAIVSVRETRAATADALGTAVWYRGSVYFSYGLVRTFRAEEFVMLFVISVNILILALVIGVGLKEIADAIRESE